ncbi:Mn-dependent transcriptional regulator [Desulfitobacterium dichloroeliminans LMG P-21439]|uniref:Manganese transport regulator n=1 Tax=Desulfitobacterium dichloroeliminans (strain LMG P-21439 / DCA1) TaxID=871963 RepID=L0FAN8_DESDL|nr:iron dependent repressor, metal binding and dimerization domain protein [Desulfitobacterium dichloroeliminans]AGA70075.1 Mn-dependent transcriptional regulator [Desulfitobacterium dichloroeliminans LMG P-21439]
MLSPSLEDYLEEIYRFSLASGVVRVTDISKKLGVSLPSVSKALQKLNNQGYINYRPYEEILLTDQGCQKGSYLVERNQMLQEFLFLIQSQCDVSAETEAIEHYISDSTIQALHQLVGFFKENPTCYDNFLCFKEVKDEAKDLINI